MSVCVCVCVCVEGVGEEVEDNADDFFAEGRAA